MRNITYTIFALYPHLMDIHVLSDHPCITKEIKNAHPDYEWYDWVALQTSYSGIAYRTTGSNTTFTELSPSTLSWGPASNFALVALVSRGDYLYMFGTPPDRQGGIKLARAEGASGAGSASGWEYWDGTTWQTSESAAIFIVPPPVSELSVQFNSFYGRYVMMYRDQSLQPPALIIRDASNLDGAWTGENKSSMTRSTQPSTAATCTHSRSTAVTLAAIRTHCFSICLIGVRTTSRL